MREQSYQYYRDVFRGRLIPFAYMDLDLSNANIELILRP
jgi:hypothetical protein